MRDTLDTQDQTATWDTATAVTWQSDLPPMPRAAKVLCLPVQSERATMLVVDVYLECPGLPGGYKTYFVVERAGAQIIPLRLSSFESMQSPRAKALQDEPLTEGEFPIAQARLLRLKVRDDTFPGTVLAIGPLSWTDEIPLLPINDAECLLEDFTATRFWDMADWVRNDRCTLAPEDGGVQRVWFFAQPWYRERPGRFHRISFTKHCRRDIAAFQAVTVGAAVDRRATFSLIFTIDGRDVTVIDRRRGLGDGEELRVPLAGAELTAITFELEEASESAGQSPDQTISAMLRWFLLERRGADPAGANEVRGMPAVTPGAGNETLEDAGLPVGILFGRDDLPALRAKIASGGAARIYAEIVAEAESHLAYQPEPHVGRYLPIDYGNSQGAGRMSAHMQEMAHFTSCMIYSGLVYALSGAAEHGEVARRALLSTLRCDEWASGFVSRIPSGLPGYRAPFVTASAACAVALCYDFIYPLLSADERRETEDALYEKAIPWLDLYLRLYGEGYLLESNQGPVFTRGLIYAARVAQRSHPDVVPLLDRWIAWFRRMLAVCYEADGSTNEGPSYWEYTTNETASALLAIARYTGQPVAALAPPNLPNSMDYMLHMRSLSTETLSFLNIGDCTVRESNYMSGVLLFFARQFQDSRAQWLWNTFYAQRRHAPGSAFFGSPHGAYVSDALLTLLMHEDAEAPAPQLPPSARFGVCDRVVWRTGATYGDTLLFFEGGPMIPGHAHYDKGQFLLEVGGERLVADPGMVNYADPASEMLHNSSCHNVVTIRERNQSCKDLRHAVVIEACEDTDLYNYLRADVSGAYQELEVFKRHLLFARPDYIVLLDELVSREDGLQWHLHAAGDLTVDGALVTIDAPRAGMRMRFAASAPLQATTGAFYEGPTRLTSNLTLAPAENVRSLWIAAVLVPYAKPVSSAVILESHALADGAQFRVGGAWGEDTITVTSAQSQSRIRVVRRAASTGREQMFSVGDRS
jgi:hypothetical protein